MWNPRRHRVSRNPGRLPTGSALSLAGDEAAAFSPVTTAVPPPTQPTSGPRGGLVVASLNARSICNKSADICDIIKQHNVDLFTVCENWQEEDSDLSVRSVCPSGYRSIDAPRSSSRCTSAGQRGGGIVLIYGDSIVAKRFAVDAISANVRIHFDDAQDLTLKRHRIYRLPNGPVTVDFYEELSSVFELLVVHSAHHWRLQYSSRRSLQ